MLVVTGPTGNVGMELTRMLVEHGSAPPFRIAAHNPDKVRAIHGEDVPVVPFDYDDQQGWDTVLEDVETLFLLFPLPHPKTVKTRMIPFIHAAVAAGCQRIVYVSVPGADRYKAVPHYGVERHLESTGVPLTVLRCSYFMQNLVRAISTHGVDIADRGEIFIPAGKGRTSFIDARDVATVALGVIEHPEEHPEPAYTLSGPEQLDLYETAEILTQALDRPIRYVRPSLPRFWTRMTRRGVTWDTQLFMTIVYTLTRFGKNEPTTDELPKLLGRPPTDLREFAARERWRWEQREWT